MPAYADCDLYIADSVSYRDFLVNNRAIAKLRL